MSQDFSADSRPARPTWLRSGRRAGKLAAVGAVVALAGTTLVACGSSSNSSNSASDTKSSNVSAAAKEALAKALGAPKGLLWTDAEVRRAPGGRPSLHVSGTVAEAAARLGVTSWHISLSHDGGVAVAVVIAEHTD